MNVRKPGADANPIAYGHPQSDLGKTFPAALSDDFQHGGHPEFINHFTTMTLGLNRPISCSFVARNTGTGWCLRIRENVENVVFLF